MNSVFRILSLLCGLAFLTIGWVWASWIALLGWLLGGIGWGLLVLARRFESKSGDEQTKGQARLDAFVRAVLVVSALVSVLALGITLAAN